VQPLGPIGTKVLGRETSKSDWSVELAGKGHSRCTSTSILPDRPLVSEGTALMRWRTAASARSSDVLGKRR